MQTCHKNSVLHYKNTLLIDNFFCKREIGPGKVKKVLNRFKSTSAYTANQKTQIITSILEKAKKHFCGKITKATITIKQIEGLRRDCFIIPKFSQVRGIITVEAKQTIVNKTYLSIFIKKSKTDVHR